MAENGPIRSFRDLDVYNRAYDCSVFIMTKILPKLPESEKYDLKDQMSRACKAVPRLIAEGYAKRHQKAGFQKYLDDAMAESNEMVVCLSHCRDLYGKYISLEECEKMIKEYDVTGRQLYKLTMSWSRFKKREGFET